LLALFYVDRNRLLCYFNYVKISAELAKKIKNIKLMAFDFDGIFTDAKVIIDQDGRESIICSRRDSLGTNQLKRIGIKLAVISMEPNPIVMKRCEKLKIECLVGNEKLPIFRNLIKREKLKASEAAFMGDDLNDLDCLEDAGLALTVADGAEQCKKIADYVTTKRGGDHAVREVCDVIMKTRGEDYENIYNKYEKK